jgi:hypothetical protein
MRLLRGLCLGLGSASIAAGCTYGVPGVVPTGATRRPTRRRRAMRSPLST